MKFYKGCGCTLEFQPDGSLLRTKCSSGEVKPMEGFPEGLTEQEKVWEMASHDYWTSPDLPAIEKVLINVEGDIAGYTLPQRPSANPIEALLGIRISEETAFSEEELKTFREKAKQAREIALIYKEVWLSQVPPEKDDTEDNLKNILPIFASWMDRDRFEGESALRAFLKTSLKHIGEPVPA